MPFYTTAIIMNIDQRPQKLIVFQLQIAVRQALPGRRSYRVTAMAEQCRDPILRRLVGW